MAAFFLRQSQGRALVLVAQDDDALQALDTLVVIDGTVLVDGVDPAAMATHLAGLATFGATLQPLEAS